ncbi:DoxX family membrane protein, partial [Streptomyces massasporeus]|uniref:DoxX family membrane protein n=1 Tax=Streptomyces massasporeus TaxID=67324 RepID=UPI00331A3229
MTRNDRRDLGLLLLRLGAGGALAAHGAQKLFGWFGGHGIEGTGQFMESIGYVPGKASATVRPSPRYEASALGVGWSKTRVVCSRSPVSV